MGGYYSIQRQQLKSEYYYAYIHIGCDYIRPIYGECYLQVSTSVEEAKAILDKFMISRGCILLSQENFNKLKILL